MKRICVIFLAALFLLLSLPPAFSEEEHPVFRGFDGGYQYVLLGEYPYDCDGIIMGNDPYSSDVKTEIQPVLWRILSLEDNTLLMLTENVIELQQVQFINDPEKVDSKKYEKNLPFLETYAVTDLCRWMNTDMLAHLFGDDPIVNAMLPEGENGENGKLFCMSSAQFVKSSYGWRPNKDPTSVRVAGPTPYARKRRIFREGKRKNINFKAGGSPYWCSTKTANYRFQIVGYDGHLSAGVITRENIGLRPAIRLDVNLIDVKSGKGTKKDPFILKYTGEVPVVVSEVEPEEAPGTAPEPAAEPETEAEMPAVPEEEPEAEPAEADEPGQEAEASGEQSPEAAEGPGQETAGETADPEETVIKDGTAVISFLGDCSIGDALQSVTKANSYHSVVDREGYAWPFSQVQKYIGNDDMTVGNLEVVITTQDKHKNIVFPLRADPDHVNILLEGSIDVVNTANNHCWDYYRTGYVDTLQALNDAGISHFGSVYYARDNGFDDILVKEVNGIRVGFFGLTYPSNGDLKHAEELIKKLREEEHCDFIIASLHWGRETHLIPSAGSAKYAQKLINYGADMIYGHHPHVLQPVAFYNNKPVLFSTGNCTFGTLSSGMDQHAAIFQLTLEKTADGTVPRRLEAIPCKYYKTGDYRIEEETDEKEREKTFSILSPGRKLADCVNPPESFLSTGVVLFSETGEVKAD